jgi:hypothetical protein
MVQVRSWNTIPSLACEAADTVSQRRAAQFPPVGNESKGAAAADADSKSSSGDDARAQCACIQCESYRVRPSPYLPLRSHQTDLKRAFSRTNRDDYEDCPHVCCPSCDGKLTNDSEKTRMLLIS